MFTFTEVCVKWLTFTLICVIHVFENSVKGVLFYINLRNTCFFLIYCAIDVLKIIKNCLDCEPVRFNLIYRPYNMY